MGKLRLRITNECAGLRAPRALVTRLLATEYAAAPEAPEVVTVNLAILSDDAIARHNQRFKKKDGPTDVLAWDDGDPDPATGVTHLGDIAVSGETAVREAARRGHGWREELALYALHGLLHLLGMRDGTPAGRRAMAGAQARAFERAGIDLPRG